MITLTLFDFLDEEISVNVPACQFKEHLYDEMMIRIQTTTSVHVTKQLIIQDHVINIDFPKVKFSDLPESAIKSNKEFTFGVTFENPLEDPLTECELYLDGTIIRHRMEFKDIK